MDFCVPENDQLKYVQYLADISSCRLKLSAQQNVKKKKYSKILKIHPFVDESLPYQNLMEEKLDEDEEQKCQFFAKL